MFYFKTICILIIIMCFEAHTKSSEEVTELGIPQKNAQRYVIIDTDGGVDDALALIMAFNYHKKGLIEILAITCTYGNTNIDQVVKNVLLTRRAAGAENVKVYRGEENPLLKRQGYLDSFFGPDGFGNASYTLPPIDIKIESEHAVLALIRLARNYPNQITLITIGPLTNLAMAIQLDQQITRDLQQIVAMGGLLSLYGNVGPTTEFNFYTDPEAIDLVLKKSVCPFTILTFDVALQNRLPLNTFYELTSINTSIAQFLRKINTLNIMRAPGEPIFLSDLLAVIAGIATETVNKYESFPVAMELQGYLTRGMLVVGRTALAIPFIGSRNITFIEEFNFTKITELISIIVKN